MIGQLRLIFALLVAGLTVVVLLPFQLLGLLVWPGLARCVPIVFHKVALFVIGVRVELVGEPASTRPLMIVSNHVSWLDVLVLSSILPVSFVAKSEMKSWPILGQLAWLQRTIFVKRDDRQRSGDQANEIAERLSTKDAIVLFPEGTTSDGHGLYPFKTTLFEAARFALVASDQDHAVIQPVALNYNRLHGLPLGRQWRQKVAWPGDVGIGEHLAPLVKDGALDVAVHFGDPIFFTAESKRKLVAAEAQASIIKMLRTKN